MHLHYDARHIHGDMEALPRSRGDMLCVLGSTARAGGFIYCVHKIYMQCNNICRYMPSNNIVYAVVFARGNAVD